MITFFSTPKPFVGHIDVIQRNAIASWRRLHPDIEILLIGDDRGAAEICQEFGIRHIKEVKRNKNGTKYLADIYDRAQEIARHNLLCHVNCDIVLMNDFLLAVQAIGKVREKFLMAGRRWDVDISRPLDFSQADWQEKLRLLALQTNRQRPAQWIDYFVFSKGLYHRKIPQFLIGRPGWDNWLLWHALSSGVSLVDVSPVVYAAHQNHDYSYHPDGEKGVWEGEEARENYALLEGNRKFRTLEDATHILQRNGLRRNYRRWSVRSKHDLRRWVTPLWFRLLDVSRPVRHWIGLRQKAKTQ
ncbi:MAG: hypothetical protein PVS2B2_28010 [Candidatus Acidiferrum sp.]